MGAVSCLLYVVLLAKEPEAGASSDPDEPTGEPEGGAGVSPIEIIPRVELRQSFVDLNNGPSIHDTVTELDIQFLRRLLLRYQAPYRRVSTPEAQISGLGDIEVNAIGILHDTPSRLLAVLAGTVLDTATQPQLGMGKYQLAFGAGAALKPRKFWIAYAVAQEQFSVGGDEARPDINTLAIRLGSVLFGKQYNWLRLDADTLVDFEGDNGRLFGTIEVGTLLIGRVGLFLRTGTQLLGQRQIDYSLAAGFRYLFKLDQGQAKPAP
jgi:hypothetical protein